MTDKQQIALSIIIPSYNREEILPQTVELILKDKPSYCELLVIHQKPRVSEEFKQFLNRTEDRIRYITVDWASVTRACNLGVEKAKGEIILLLDDDVIPKPGLIAAHLRNFDDPKVGAVAGKILIPHPVKFPQHVGEIGDLGPKHETYVAEGRQQVKTGGGGNLCFRKAVFEKLGGFDTNYIKNAHRFESDFCFRLRRSKYVVIYDPEAEVKHLEFKSGGIRTWKNEANLSPSFYRNEMLFYLKNKPDGWMGRYLWLDFSQRVPSRNLKIFFWRTLAYFRGIIWGVWVYLTRYKLASSPKRFINNSSEPK
jgi:GT2 family glycosyltransferase